MEEFESPAAVARASMVSVDATVMGPLYTVELVVGAVPLVV
jgi:hypothetical protein